MITVICCIVKVFNISGTWLGGCIHVLCLLKESKYLGGDIELTHLVEGLDYALLQKVGEPPLFYLIISGCV